MGVDPLTATVIGLVGSAIMGSQSQSQPEIPAPQPVTPPPQASKAPDVQGVQAAQGGMGQAGGAPGVAQTMLTGPSGVNPDDLKLGKSTLLGG